MRRASASSMNKGSGGSCGYRYGPRYYVIQYFASRRTSASLAVMRFFGSHCRQSSSTSQNLRNAFD